jgi:hypothetical protein
MCGYTEYNRTADLCCQGILVKKGILQNKKCCGIKPYLTTSHTCSNEMKKNPKNRRKRQD